MRLISVLLIFLAFSIGAAAQGSAEPSNAPAIAAALKSLPSQRGLNELERKQTDDLLHQGQDDETQADQLAQQLQSLRQLADGAEAAAQKIDDALGHDDGDAQRAWRAALPQRATVEQLESLLARERAALADARGAAATIDAESRRQASRLSQMREELIAAHTILDNSVTAAGDSTTPPALANAQRLRVKAEQRLANAQIALLDLENRSYEPRMRLLSAQSRERQRSVDELAQRVAALEALALNRTGADASDLCTRIAQERSTIDEHSRLLTDAADTNITLCNQLTHAIQRIGDLRAQQQQLDATRQDTAQALTNTEERVRIGGVTEAVGLILLAEQRKLKPLGQLKRELVAVQTELAKTRMDLIDLREQQDSLSDVGASVTQALTSLIGAPPDVREKLRAGLYRVLAMRADMLPRLSMQQTRLSTLLAETEQQLADLTATTAKLGAVLDERLLWTPSHEPVSLSWAGHLPEDTVEFFVSPRWTRAVSSAANVLTGTWLVAAPAVLAWLGLFWLGRRAPRHLERIAAPMRRIRSDRYQLTGHALFWTVLRATPGAFALWLLAKLLQQVAGNGSGFAEALGRAFAILVLPAAMFGFLRALTIENGLAHFHFRWPRPRRIALYAAAPLFAALVLPPAFLLVLLTRPGTDAPLDTVGRALLALALAGVGALGWRLLAPGKVWTARNIVLTEPLRLRQITRFAFSTMCFALAALDLLGYFVTAEALAGRLLASFGAALVVATLYGLAVRWLVLGERRLALKRMLEKQTSEGERTEGETMPELPESEEITIASVSAQTRRLLRALTVIGTGLVLLWLWSDVTPAFGLFGNIALWDSSQTIAGKEIALHVSLRDAFEAFVVLAITWVATRNLPGLLEVGLLRRLQVDAPTRYAITSVTRYVIVFTGTIFGLSMLGLRWSNLQWLAAGFSVGLGFGMQEIFANFISGLIVLFERPFRIGDIISIGGVEGTVARIRTRATTLVDWDNKEVVVPNKSFITDRLVNWTLSDSTTRLVIKVGIAYRNDPKLAQKLLLEIAAANPQVLGDPAPTCWMMGFGNSTLDFELRVYVAEISQRNLVKTELQFRIADVFKEHDIELAFAQMDLWIRNPIEMKTALEQADTSENTTQAKAPPPG
jgi:potassium-dependent mechanosensitive channel